ncbi:uncharacterized protein LOC124500553 [Dermatophagoides farinae]|uniref:Uncharacterized protein n=1 Tax=Dermatophagoides farinae TaxID=6954 RepID=A0A922I418_DERFA|nr:uncharacterized protein LOC124500553 [Dermatophagoides farinae]KAH7639615.1 hypothetical protein HUG17_3648 [Dermatophagoides farinae]KAH9521671.1 hypothetical protein DERF_005307 [Dermatophagoides farinae]
MSPINPTITLWLSLFAIILLAILHTGNGAPRTVRDDGGAFETVDTDSFRDDQHPTRSMIHTIIDMIKRMFGFDERTAIVREDGTVEYVDNGGQGNSFLSRIGRRVMSFINMLLNMFMGDSSIPPFDFNTARTTILNELDKDGIHLNNG